MWNLSSHFQICCNSFRDYNWFWIFLVGPHVGAILGVCIFHFLLKNAGQDEIDSGVHHDSPLVLVSTIETRPWMQDRPCDVDHNKTKSEYNSYASMTLWRQADDNNSVDNSCQDLGWRSHYSPCSLVYLDLFSLCPTHFPVRWTLEIAIPSWITLWKNVKCS